MIEEDLDIKGIMPLSMIQVLMKKYDGGESKFEYRNFTNDLEKLEETNRAIIFLSLRPKLRLISSKRKASMITWMQSHTIETECLSSHL